MTVVVAMAEHAIGGRFAAASRGLLMAVRAAELLVRARECEMGLLVMIEFPDGPAVGRMTALTLLSEPAMMDILRGMTAVAVGGGAAECLSAMTLRAADDRVQPQQREARQIVIEVDAPG